MTDLSYKVQISQDHYEELLERDAWLSALEAAGLDNWEGVDEALVIYDKRNELSSEPVHLKLIRNIEAIEETVKE